jgi:hypothetical protein
MDAIICLAQDPAYTDVDEFVLGKHEIIKVPDAKGFLEVDDSTIVISICADIPVRQIVTDLTQPAILIWDRVRYDPSNNFLMSWDVLDFMDTQTLQNNANGTSQADRINCDSGLDWMDSSVPGMNVNDGSFMDMFDGFFFGGNTTGGKAF